MYGFSETNTQGRVCGSQVSLVVCAMLLRTTNTTNTNTNMTNMYKYDKICTNMYKYDMQFVNRVSISVHLILRVKLFAEPRPQMSETMVYWEICRRWYLISRVMMTFQLCNSVMMMTFQLCNSNDRPKQLDIKSLRKGSNHNYCMSQINYFIPIRIC